MAPKKRAATEKASPATRAAPPPLRTTRNTFKRTTRSQAANTSPGGAAASTKSAAPYKWPEVAPKKKKTTAKAAPKKKTAAKPAPKKKVAVKKEKAEEDKAEEVEEEISEDGEEPEDDEGGQEEDADDKVDAAAPEMSGGDKADTKTIVIEHCKQCYQFKTRANMVKEGLEGVPGIEVIINPVKPRRGCFEIREEGGETFISLLGMKRPFQPMRDLVMQEVIDNIIEKIL